MANEKPTPEVPTQVPAVPDSKPVAADPTEGKHVEKPEHDPAKVTVEHNDEDPNSPNYQGPPTAENPAQSV